MSTEKPRFTDRLALRLADFVIRRAWLVVAVALIAMVTARLTVLKTLSRML